MIGHVMTSGQGDNDLLLYSFAHDLVAQGFHIGGVVQINTPCPSAGRCDMDVLVLPSGPILRISQNLGAASRGCRLDTSALETSVGLVTAQLNKNVDLLIINKFGKQEAAGRGFRDVIAKAIILDIPVLVGLNSTNQKAFHDFTGHDVMQVPSKKEALLGWFQQIATGVECMRSLHC